MSIEILTALAVIAMVLIMLVAAGFGLELIRKEKLVQDGSVLLVIAAIVIGGIFLLYPLGG